MLRLAQHDRILFGVALAANVSCVQTACHSRVSRSFDDGAAVGEQCHLVWIVPELEHELVVADHTMRLQALTQFAEVDWPMTLVDLH